MALSRLILPRSSLRIDRYGFPNPVRWFSSQSSDVEIEKPSRLKKTSVPRAQRAMAVESFVKKYMETNPGVFPKATHIQNEVGGSWYTVTGILNNIKEKILGTPQPENHHSSAASTPAKDTMVSTVLTTHCVPDSGIEIHDHHDSAFHADKVLQAQDKEENSGHSTATAVGECSSGLTVYPASSGATKMIKPSSLSELKMPPIVLCTEPGSDFHADEGLTSDHVTPLLSRKYHSEGMVLSDNVPDSSQLEWDSSHMQPKELVSNMRETSDPSVMPNLGELSHFKHDKMGTTGCKDQQEHSTTCSLSSSSSVEMSTKFSIPVTSLKGSKLSDIFKKFADDAAVSEAKIGKMETQETLSDILPSFRRDRNSEAIVLSTDISQQSNFTGMWQDCHAYKSLSNVYESQQPGKEMDSSILTQNVIPDVAESFAGSRNLMGLEDLKGQNNQASVSITNTNRDISIHSFFRHFEEPQQKDEAKRSEIKGLIDCIKGDSSIASHKQKISSCKTVESMERSQVGIHSMGTQQSFDKKEKKTSSDFHALRRKSSNSDPLKVLPVGLRTQADETNSPDFTKPIGHTRHSVLTDKEKSNEIQHKISLVEGADQNKAVVKFLNRNTKEHDIVHAFKNCGDILKVEISTPEGAFYQNANIFFKTREGLQNALVRTDIVVKNANITVEAAATGEDISKRITVPSLIGYPNVPVALVKNPTRTVKITHLTHDISSKDVVAALGSCGNNVTGFFFGTLDSVAYVEFEEEDDKEVALAKHSIDVRGKQLLISRIDVPRTTVVRISHHHTLERSQLVKACNSLGKTRDFYSRNSSIVDVHFKTAEWPNMLKILNRLNEVQVDGYKLQAQPASVIPPEILQILWQHPEERKYVKNVVRKLLQNLDKQVVHIADLTDLPNFY